MEKELLEKVVGVLPGMEWKWYDSRQLRAWWRGGKYTFFLDEEGKVQVWQGSMLLLSWTEVEGGGELYDRVSQGLREKALEELAACFEPAPAPHGIETLYADDVEATPIQVVAPAERTK